MSCRCRVINREPPEYLVLVQLLPYRRNYDAADSLVTGQSVVVIGK